jgi:predicted transcriptional regulator
MEKTTLYLTDDLQRELQEIAKREKRSQASLIREALVEYVTARSTPWPESIGMGQDGEIPAERAKEWVRREWARKAERPPKP